jgi:hypothetical protein
MSWAYSFFSIQGFSALLGVTEIVIALLIAARPLSARVALVGSASAVGMFLTTLSFLLTTPGVWEASAGGFPALSVAPGQFLVKDVVLLGASLWMFGEDWRVQTASRSHQLGGEIGRRRSDFRCYVNQGAVQVSYDLDGLACAGCGGRLRFLATIEDRPIVTKILAHLGLPTAGPSCRLRVRHRSAGRAALDTAAAPCDRVSSATRTARTRRLACVWHTAGHGRTSANVRSVLRSTRSAVDAGYKLIDDARQR